ncbi:hypothetical protein Z043_125422 [Scleropages formosus]|uniref:Interferon-induced very large GTPase 1-like n=1 Tax=Scleropages formosus TaxID=113540 RepID=A0A0N8JV20_SCLFO|nr:hypothetical protein Z043_125422 [Scleropages formosus]
MHRRFLRNKDPIQYLEDRKDQYLSDFMDLFREKDHCQRKAKDFAHVCLRPAVTEYVNRSLGIQIVDEMLSSSQSSEYSSRSFFQFTILKELLEKDDFESYIKYILKYEIFVKDWILRRIENWFSKEGSLGKLKNNSLAVIMKKIHEAIGISQIDSGGQALPDDAQMSKMLVEKFCKALSQDIHIPMDTTSSVLFQLKTKPKLFASYLSHAVEDLKTSLEKEFYETANIHETLRSLSIKPQDELFKRVFGCGKQCPFCKVPCEAAGQEHREHFASVHRPKGLGQYSYISTDKLCETICTTSVHSEARFRNSDTDYQFHPYKDYRAFYPDWHIPPDRTIEASNYWKYVLVKYNDRFAELCKAKPANLPSAWQSITQENARDSLNIIFNMKR